MDQACGLRRSAHLTYWGAATGRREVVRGWCVLCGVSQWSAWAFGSTVATRAAFAGDEQETS